MRIFPPALAAQLARRDGAAPVWLLKFTVSAVDYILCQDAVTVTPWGLTAKPWVASWGQMRQGISGALSDFNVSELSVDLISDPTAAVNMRSMALARQLNGLSVSVYLWADGCTDAPFEMARYRVMEIDLLNETACNLRLQDESMRYESYYPGTIVNKTDFPAADPDDVGKVIPIVFGTVKKLLALSVDAGIRTTLSAGMTAIQTTMNISDTSGFWVGMWCGCDNETMLVTAIAGNIVTVTRAYDTTTATTHQKGADVIEIRPNAFAYIVSDYPLTSINKVYGKLGNKVMDVTALCTLYTGKTGNEHVTYPGRAVVTVPGFITISQAAQLMLNDGIGVSDLLTVVDGILISDGITITDSKGVSHTFTISDGKILSDGINVTDTIAISDLLTVLNGISVSDNIALSDAIGISDAITISDNIAVADGISVGDNIAVTDGITVGDNIAVSTGSHQHYNPAVTLNQVNYNGMPSNFQTSAGSWTGNATVTAWFNDDGLVFPTDDLIEVMYKLSIVVYCNAGFIVASGGNTLFTGTGSWSGVVNVNVSSNLAAVMNIHGVDITCYYNSMPPTVGVGIRSAERTLRYGAYVNSSAAMGVAKSGSASKTGTTTKTGAASKTGTITKTGGASRGGSVTRFGNIVKIGGASSTGTVTRGGSISKTGAAGKTGTVTLSGTTGLTGGVSLTGTVGRTGSVTRTGNVTRSGSVAKTGTVTLSGNSVANTLIGDAILVDVTSPTTAPQDCVTKLLGATCKLVGAFPSGYAFNGVVNTSRRATEWCHELARQCRSYFAWSLGSPSLIVRPDALVPVKTISEIRLNNGAMIHGQRLTDVGDVINTINLRYNRDWSTNNSGDSAYQLVVRPTPNAASVTAYGVRERPELFRFDFVTDATMANSLAAFYLLWQAFQRWKHTQECYLFDSSLEFADAVKLGFLANQTGEVAEMGFNPGNNKNMDKIQLTVIE